MQTIDDIVKSQTTPYYRSILNNYKNELLLFAWPRHEYETNENLDETFQETETYAWCAAKVT